MASKEGLMISLDFVSKVGDETNIPFSLYGKISTLYVIREIIASGAEEVIINIQALYFSFIREAVEPVGSSTITVCIDVKE